MATKNTGGIYHEKFIFEHSNLHSQYEKCEKSQKVFHQNEFSVAKATLQMSVRLFVHLSVHPSSEPPSTLILHLSAFILHLSTFILHLSTFIIHPSFCDF